MYFVDKLWVFSIKHFTEFLCLTYIRGGKADKPVVDAVENFAAFDINVDFGSSFFDGLIDDLIGRYREGFIRSFDEHDVAMSIDFFIIDDGMIAPDGLVFFQAFDDPPNFLPREPTFFGDDINAFFRVFL